MMNETAVHVMRLRAVLLLRDRRSDQVTRCTNSEYDLPKLSSIFGLCSKSNFFINLAKVGKIILLPFSQGKRVIYQMNLTA
jgi:hypothetical protein